MIAKKQITMNFDRASTSYEKVATVQQNAAKILTDLCKTHLPKPPDSVLDLGTGSGYVVDLLLQHFPDSNYTLNDISSNMLKLVEAKFGANQRFKFILEDMESLKLTTYYDLIISNLAMQWVDQLENTIYKFYNNSHNLAFSCLLHGTFHEWQTLFLQQNLISPVKSYPTLKKLVNYISSFRAKNTHFLIKDFTLKFASPYDFIKFLKTLGANASASRLGVVNLKNIMENSNEAINITYKVFFCLLHK